MSFILMPHVLRRVALSLMVLLATGTLCSAVGAQEPAKPSTVSGVVRDAHGAPVRLVAVRSSRSNVSTLTDDKGRFRLELPLGEDTLNARRLGYRPASIPVTVVAGGTRLDVTLDQIPVSLQAVIITGEDDAARRLVAAAIARKQRFRGNVHDYRYHGDVRLVLRDLKVPADSAPKVQVITESQTEAYWEQPDQYQETIIARRQTGNVPADNNLIGVGQLLNISRERILFARFELPSPIADDALDRYDYRLLDTLVVDGRRVFRLSVEPKPNGSPAFVGVMDVVDSTFDVTGIDVGVNREVRVPGASDIRYQQRFRELAGGRWMPVSVELTATFDFRPLLLVSLRHVASLSDFRFNEGRRPVGLGEYALIVAPTADRNDSVAWAALHVGPLSPEESTAWRRIDSIASQPKSPMKLMAAGAAWLLLADSRDFFHFNRADGAYVGVARKWETLSTEPAFEPTFKVGYGTGSRVWQYRAGNRVRLSESQRMWIGATYQDETVNRTTLTSTGYDPTLSALFSTDDPFDYHRERGLTASFTSKLVQFTDFTLGYVDVRQSSLVSVVDRPPIRLGDADTMRVRPNPAIDEGRLRAVSAGVTFDSRPLLRQGAREMRLDAPSATRAAITAEWSPGRRLASDFGYRRVMLHLERRQESFGMGVTTLTATGGIGTSALPLQRAFTVDGGARVLEAQVSPFSTIGPTNFVGSRAGVIALEHDFDRLLFTKSRLPGVRDIPFTFTAHAALFWAELPVTGLDDAAAARRLTLNTTRDPYREIGFTIGNLTPSLRLLNFYMRFAWQISNYPTTHFKLSTGLRP